MTATMPVLCLASASPRRQELLCQIGVPNLVLAADIDETARTGEEPAQPAARCGLPVLAADTTVVLDGRMLGKPVTREEGVEMLLALAGRTHEVLTAVVLLAGSVQAPSTRCRSVRSQVRFRSISAADAGRYWESGEPRDKAGGYAVQGLGAVFVAGLTGSYSGVMGLPLFETAALLQEAGIPVWAGAGP